jgi:hypothetical protein
MYKWAPTSNRQCTTNRIPRNSLKTNNRKISNRARTHISIFNFSPSTTQNPAQLIPLSAIAALPAEAEAPNNRRGNAYKIPKTAPPENSTVSLFLSRLPAVAGRFTRASLRFHARPAHKIVPSASLLPGSAQNIENDVTSTKQTTEDFLPGATTTSSLSSNNAPFTTKISPENVQVKRKQPFSMSGRPPLTLFAGWANMARTS